MGKSTAKTVTAAPRPQAEVAINVKLKSTGRPVRGAYAQVLFLDFGEQARNRSLGRTDARGRIRFTVEVGQVEVQLRFPDHRGDGFTALPGAADVTVVFSGFLKEGKHAFDVELIQFRSQVTIKVTEPSGTVVPGARVVSPLGDGFTDHRGEFTTGGLEVGKSHRIEVRRNGHGPTSETEVGPVIDQVDLTGLTQVANRTLNVKVRNVWGKVVSSNIEVGGDLFVDWFTDIFVVKFPATHPTLRYRGKAAPTFPFAKIMAGASGTQAFKKLFDELPKWWGPELTLEEFVSVFFIVANETGGSFKPISEVGTLGYMFYLNKRPNRLAGEQLKEKGILSDAKTVLAWNNKGEKNFPGVGANGVTDAHLRECDFWKYRGRGFVQTTLRPLYIDRVDPVLKQAGLNESEKLTSAELDDAVLDNEDVYYPILKTELSRRRRAWAQTNAEDWKSFGYQVAGTTNHEYAALYEWRCQEMYRELRDAADKGQLVLR